MFCIAAVDRLLRNSNVPLPEPARYRLGNLRVLGLRAGRAAQSDQATPIDKVITDKPIIKVPGCRRSRM